MHLMPKQFTTGTFAECVAVFQSAVERELRLMRVQPLRYVCGWVEYKGPEIAPVSLYIRSRSDRIVVANINGYEGLGTGRMPVILDALKATGLDVVFENVLNPRLESYLRRQGFDTLMHPGWALPESGPETLVLRAPKENPTKDVRGGTA